MHTLPSVGTEQVVQGIILHFQVARVPLLNIFAIILQGLCSLIIASVAINRHKVHNQCGGIDCGHRQTICCIDFHVV